MTKTLLPAVYNDQPITAQSDATQEFIALWMKALGERAKLMIADDRLMVCAQKHAEYLASRTPEQIAALPDDGHGSHVGENNSTPNMRVRAAGYALPLWHGDGNTVEFNTHTSRGPARALELLLGSDAHRPALMGEGFWEPAFFWGVGNAEGDYVVLVCPPEI